MSRAKILIVDDHKPIARLMASVLKAKGYDVGAVHSGEAALEVLVEVHPDLVLLDVQLRGMDGMAVLRALQADETLGGIPVVLVSASDQVRGLAMLNGAAGVLPKPFSLDELVHVVDSNILRLERIAS